MTSVVFLSQFGISIVYFILSAKSINSFIKYSTGNEPGMCIVMFCFALLILPLTFLKSPQDFW